MKNTFSLSTNVIILVILSLLGMFLALELLGDTHLTIDAFDIVISLTPFQRGVTSINLPPVGEISALTHWLPFQLEITFLNVNLDMLSDNVENIENLKEWQDKLISEAIWAAVWFGLRSILVSFLGGGLAAFFLASPHIPRRFLKGGLLGALFFILLILFTVVIPYNPMAFESPQYYGVLSAAPWALSFFDQGLTAVQTLGERLQTIGDGFIYLFEGLEQLTPLETGTSLKVLHVSDIHNNPAAIEFMEKVVYNFDIDMVIDTGDITDYGTIPEAELVSAVADMEVPYVLAPGNHDSPRVINYLRDRGVIVLENEIQEVLGLQIAGISDPAAASYYEVVTPEEEVIEYAYSVEPFLKESTVKPDLLAVHNPLIGEILAEYAPVILCGHTHVPSVNETDDYIMINAGTTGAAGIRGLERPEENYSMFILYFNQDEADNHFLAAADYISVPQIPGGFNLERFFFSGGRRVEANDTSVYSPGPE